MNFWGTALPVINQSLSDCVSDLFLVLDFPAVIDVELIAGLAAGAFSLLVIAITVVVVIACCSARKRKRRDGQL